MHRPPFDVDAAARRDDPGSVEGRVFGWMQRLARPRATCRRCTRRGSRDLLAVDDPHVLAWRRRHPRSGHFVGLVNFAEHPVSVDVRAFEGLGELETVLSATGRCRCTTGAPTCPGWGSSGSRSREGSAYRPSATPGEAASGSAKFVWSLKTNRAMSADFGTL